MVSNDHIEVNADSLKQLKELSRKESSTTSQKSKQRYSTKSPEQSFTIGQLVYLRNSLDKNTPRDLYIVEEIMNEKKVFYFLIRKLQSSLHPRLYKVLADELIAAPFFNTSSLDDTTPSKSPPEPSIPIKSKPPTRKAARIAREKIAATINTVAKPDRFRHGWITDDQDSDDDVSYLFTSPVEVSSTASSVVTTDSPSPPTSDSDDHDAVVIQEDYDSVSTDHDMENTDETLQLTNGFTLEQDQLINAPTPLRRHPLSPTLLRSRHSVVPPVPRTNSSQLPNNLPPRAPKKPRVPTPKSPSQVCMNMVNDVTEAVSRIDTQIFTNSNRPRRSVTQPDYKMLHTVGRSHTSSRRDKEDEDR